MIKLNIIAMKKMNLILASLLIGGMLQAQQIEDFDLTKGAGAYGHKKLKDAPKRVFIAEFFINYQLMYSAAEVARGGSQMGGGFRGDAKASLTLGIPGISTEKLQESVDNLYKEYTDKLKTAGFEIIEAEEVAATEYMSEWNRSKGGTINEAQNPGYLNVTPTGYEFFYKKITKDGRGKGTFLDYTPKLSKALGGAIIAKVNLVIPVFEDGESQASKALAKTAGGVAKVVARANYRISPSEWVATKTLKGGFSITSYSNFGHTESMKKQGFANYTIKKPVKIEGVFDPKKKYKAVESAASQMSGTNMGAFTIFNVDDRELNRVQAVECDPEKFLNGAYEASQKFIMKSMNSFLDFATK
ncbi:MAG: hypothetical protein ABJP45_17025 [Cyclobacteriaceae bacterium]